MYSFVNATCLQRTTGAQWKEVDLSAILVYDIYNTYSKVFLELSNPFLSENIIVDFMAYRSEFSSFAGVLNTLLTSIGNRTLDTVTTIPNSAIKYAKYSDAYYAAYKVDTCIIGQELPIGYPESEKTDLVITRPTIPTDLSLIHDYCLVSVNGLFHMTDADDTHAYVKGGGKTLHHSKNNQLGILSFLDIGKLTQVKITDENIYANDTDSKLRDRTYFWIDQDLTNKSVVLVLGGYLVFPTEGIFWQSGERTLALNFNALPMIERYMESAPLLDMSSLGLSEHSDNPDMINVTEFFSDAVLKKYLTMDQSFLVIIDTPNLFTNKSPIRHSGLPGMFTSYIDPVYPLVVGYGRMVEYWKTWEDGQYSVTVQDSFYRNFVLSHVPRNELENVTPNNVPFQTFFHSRGYFLEIGSYK